MADVNDRIRDLLTQNEVVLFMKGDKERGAMCGFSHRAMQIVNALGVPFATVDVLSDPEIREGIKSFSNWPTIPQLYIKGEFIGGADICYDLYQSGELEKKVQGAAT